LDCDREETLQHLFWAYPFADKCWDFICPQRQKDLSVQESFQDLRHKLKVPFSMEIIILASWALWIYTETIKSSETKDQVFKAGKQFIWKS
jgi:hypothetical protein